MGLVETSKEIRRKQLGFNNPKKDWWAKRKAQGKWIGGRFYPPEALMQFKKRLTEMTEKQKNSLWQKIKRWFKKLWLKIKWKRT